MIVPVILAGGSGTRLWPLSRELYPKQMLQLTGDRTMLQNTILRLGGVDGMGWPMIIGNAAHRFLARQQMAEAGIRPASVFLEPCGRNTAPAVAVAALSAVQTDADAVLLVLPADHLIRDVPKFHRALETGVRFAEAGYLVTFGIVPDRPETGYGYIRRGEAADLDPAVSRADREPAFVIDEFVEKPDLPTAKTYVDSGLYCWNSGMFMFSAGRVLSELRRHAPEIVHACEKALDQARRDAEFLYLDPEAFAGCPADSIDYAVMEKTDRGVMIPLDAGWDDLGSWEALWSVGGKDKAGNAVSGDVICVNVENCLVAARSRLVAALNVRDLAVVETPDAVLVADLSGTQDVKKIVEALNAAHRPETRIHATEVRSWGLVEVLGRDDHHLVRRVTVFPGASLQLDGPRAAAMTWTAVRGEARLTVDGAVTDWAVSQAVTVNPQDAVLLENPGHEPLMFIEVTAGPHHPPDHLEDSRDQHP